MIPHAPISRDHRQQRQYLGMELMLSQRAHCFQVFSRGLFVETRCIASTSGWPSPVPRIIVHCALCIEHPPGSSIPRTTSKRNPIIGFKFNKLIAYRQIAGNVEILKFGKRSEPFKTDTSDPRFPINQEAMFPMGQPIHLSISFSKSYSGIVREGRRLGDPLFRFQEVISHPYRCQFFICHYAVGIKRKFGDCSGIKKRQTDAFLFPVCSPIPLDGGTTEGS